MTQDVHPCLHCGVCCTNYRVEFSVYELQSLGGTVPDALTHEVNGNRVRMNGTARFPIRCVALTDFPNGTIGCGIYEQRSRPCRDYPFASQDCQDVRVKYGFPLLTDEEIQRWVETA